MQYLEKICCFLIFARIFLHMCPSEKYEKYLSALTGWIALCIFLSPFLSGDMFRESYETWEKKWEAQAQSEVGLLPEEIEEAGERAATQIAEEMEVEEMEEGYEMGTDQ